jgi:hypothetical protein
MSRMQPARGDTLGGALEGELMRTTRQWMELFRGAVRESLASVAYTARFGMEDTRAWEHPSCYIVNDNTGNAAVVEFQTDGVVGAFSGKVAVPADEAARMIALAPPDQRRALLRLSRLPLLAGEATA